MSAVGLTDHGTVAGIIQFLKECRKQKIKPILGMEAYFCRNRFNKSKELQPDGKRGNRHLNVIAKNFEGYQNLCTLAHKASIEGYYYDARIDFELLNEYKNGLIISSACFLPDQWVNTNRGLVPINKLSLSDKIINISGHYINPTVLTCRDYIGDIYTIKANGHFGNINCTADHKIFVEKESIPQWIEAKDLDMSCRLLSPVLKQTNLNDDFNLWNNVDDFYFRKSRIKGISEKPLFISPDLCLFCGLWLSEGHVSAGGQLGFTFNSKEMHWAKFIKKFSLETFGLECSIRERPIQNRIDVSMNSEELCRLLKEYFGSKANGKFISNIFKTSSIECRRNLLKGAIVGDGSFRWDSGNRCKLTYASISRSLLSDLRDVSLSLGLKVTTASARARVDKNNIRHRKSYYLFAYGEDASRINDLVKDIPNWNTKKYNSYNSIGRKKWKKTRFVDYKKDRFFSTPIIHIDKKENVNTKVFCLSEPETKTFVADGYVVHNCLSNIVNWNLSRDRYDKAKQAATMFKDIFKEDFYLEMMYHGIDEEAKILPEIQKLSKELDIKIIVSNDSHYIEKSDAEFHEILVCVNTDRLLKDPKRLNFPYNEFYFKSKEEMYKMFGHVPSAMQNTLEIAEKCNYEDLIFVEDGGPMRLPNLKIPEEYATPFDYLEYLSWEGLKKCGWDKSKEHTERLKLELNDIKLVWDTKKWDFATYFLIVKDIMQFAKENDIEAGIRGSGYGSLVVRCLGLSEKIDPKNLIWERFLGFQNKKYIDITDLGLE